MIKGPARKKTEEDEDDFEHNREMYYDHALDAFEGVEGQHYGIIDEINNLGKLIETIGVTVVENEKEFRAVAAEEYEEMSYPGDKTLAVWHKKTYRQFSYKAMMMLVHSIFEDGLVDLYNLLVREGRINHTLINPSELKSVMRVYDKLAILDPNLPGFRDAIRGFKFIRNKIAHSDGYYLPGEHDHDGFLALGSRTDLKVETLFSPQGNNTHKMTILRSSVLTEYLRLTKKVFEFAIKGARKAPYLGPAPSASSSS